MASPRANRKGAQKKSSADSAAPLVARNRNLVKGPPGELGFAHLITPDEAFGQVKFKANVHYKDSAFNSLFESINETYWQLIPELLDAAAEKKKKDLVKVLSKADVIAYLREKVKQPTNGARIQLPYFGFDMNASYKNKDGEEVATSVKAWDSHGAPVDLKGLRLGMGSVVKPFFTIGVWAGSSPFSKWAALPTLRFVGLQVLKLKQFGGSGTVSVGEVTEADLKFLDDNFAADDLSQFVNPDKPKDKAAKGETGEPMEDDEIPF